MTSILITFIIAIVLLVGLAGLAVAFSDERKIDEIDKQYINEDGDHVYYDRRLIEKKKFAKAHPEVKDVRSFRRLFKGEKEEKSHESEI